MSKDPMFIQEIPRDSWPVYRGANPPVRVWNVGGYLTQLYEEADGALRLSITSARQLPPSHALRETNSIPWDDLQEIKGRIGFAEREAVEVYPADRDVVNVANMRHLWILPDGLPFTWRSER